MERESTLGHEELIAMLDRGAVLIKPNNIKFSMTSCHDGNFLLGFNAQSFDLDEALFDLVHRLMKGDAIDTRSHPEILSHAASIDLLLELYNHQALEFDPTG